MLEARHPLVTCIMPTADRPAFVPLAIRQFQNQDYPNRELIVLDDGCDPVRNLIPDDPRIHYERMPARKSVGAKRNLACEKAMGAIIVHWDDDDMMAPWRLSYQVDALLREKADLCGIDRVWYFGPTANDAWEYVYPKNEHPWLYGGSLCYTKALWDRNRFPDADIGEDNAFVWSGGARKLAVLPDNRFYVATIHPHNTSRKTTSDLRWQQRPIAELRGIMGAAWKAYATILADTISCVMPTANRPNFVRRAVEYFDRQDYPNRELIAVYENAADLPEELLERPDLRLLNVPRGYSIGMKRNIACEAASGSLIAQWDDDDWYAPNRLSVQAAPILGGAADITALYNTLFFDIHDRTFWECAPTVYRNMFVENVHGGTLVFRKSVWTELAVYPDASLREDADFLTQAMSMGARLRRIDGRNIYVYFRHGTNSWRFNIGEPGRVRDWRIARRAPVPESDLLNNVDACVTPAGADTYAPSTIRWSVAS